MKMQRATTPLAVAALTALLAGCGGGGHSSSTLPIAPKYTGPTASAVFHIQVPQARTISSARSPQYIPTGTLSLGVIVMPSGGTALPLQTFALVPGPNTVTINAPVAADTFDFTVYDGPNATGNKLSHGTTTFTVVSGVANTIPTTTLNGVVASFTLTQGPWTRVFVDGTAGTQVYQITALDAKANTITGTYDQPVTVTTFDPSLQGTSTIVTLSASQFAKSGDTITATYGGTPNVPQGATLNFAVGTKTVATATVAMFPGTLGGLGAAFDPTALNNQTGLNGDTLKLVGWYDSQDLTKMSINNVANIVNVGGSNVVTLLKDKSPNSFDLAPGAVVGPTYDPIGGPGMRPALDFASAKCLSRTTGFPTTADTTNHGDYTILVMMRQPTLQNFAANIVGGGYGTTGGHLFWLTDLNGHVGLARAGAPNLNYATAMAAPPSGSFLAEGDYNAQKTHMGSIFQGTAPPDSGGEFSLSGTFGNVPPHSIVVNIIGLAPITYNEVAGDTTAATTATNFSNFVNNDATLKTLIHAAPDPAAPDTVQVTQVSSVTAFSVTSAGGTLVNQTISDTTDASYALNCYSDHPDSSSDNHIEEVVIYNGLLTSAQRTNLQTYFLRKWSQLQ